MYMCGSLDVCLCTSLFFFLFCFFSGKEIHTLSFLEKLLKQSNFVQRFSIVF